MTIRRLAAYGMLTMLVTSCDGAEAKPENPSGVVDSVISRDTAIARFQRATPRVTSLTGGAGSRDQLVDHFVKGLEKRDTVLLQSLLLNQSEFGWLYYPSNPEGLPPYNLTPQLMWFLLQGNSNKGYSQLMKLRAGKPLEVVGYRCEGEPGRQGANRVWGPCLLQRIGESRDTISERLFGQIIERDGRYKFVSYANKL